MTFTTRRDPEVEAAYAELEPVVRRIARRHARVYRLQFREVLQDAAVLFCECVRSHDPARGPLQRHVRYVIGRRLVTKYKSIGRRRRLFKEVPIDDAFKGTSRNGGLYNPERPESLVPCPEYEDYYCDLSAMQFAETDDGRYLIGLAVEPPPALADRLDGHGVCRKKLRRLLTQWLVAEKGWTCERVQAAIKDAAGI